MPIDPTQLATELTTDPTNLGYKINGVFQSAAVIGSLLGQAGTLIANPVPQGQVLTPITPTGLLSLLSQTSAANVESYPNIGQLFIDITGQNRANVGVALALMLASGRIQQSEATAINAMLASTATIPDPNWQATVPGPSRLATLWGVGFVPLSMITAVTGVA